MFTWKDMKIVKMYANGRNPLSNAMTPTIQVSPITTTKDMADLSHCLWNKTIIDTSGQKRMYAFT